MLGSGTHGNDAVAGARRGDAAIAHAAFWCVGVRVAATCFGATERIGKAADVVAFTAALASSDRARVVVDAPK